MSSRPDPSAPWRRANATVWLPTSEEMAALDRRAAESGAIPERGLIESAGREIAHQVARRWPQGPVVALAGSGHNGADALVALRTLAAWGREARAVQCGSGPPEPDVLGGWDLELAPADLLPEVSRGAAVLLDGILGTGVRGAPREPQAEIIRRVNGLGVPVAAVDGPSGMDFTTGEVPGACVRADLTLALGWPKLGLLRFPARRYAGDVLALEIGFPPPEPLPGARAVTGRWVQRILRPRPADAHKGRAGYLALVAGQEGMAGASVLAARGAGRGGAGIVRVVGDPTNRTIVQGAVPEAVFAGWDDAGAVAEAVRWSDAVAIGPGLGRGEARRALVIRVLEAAGERPVVLDADALNVWEGNPAALAEILPPAALLTPHPGEMARLLGSAPGEVTDDPLGAAREAASRFGATVLLKGAPSVVAKEGRPVRVSTIARPELGSGGTGDVLTGLAGAFLAAGMEPANAASAALFVSGVAALRSGRGAAHVATDLCDELAAARREVLELPPPGEAPVLFAAPAPRDG